MTTIKLNTKSGPVDVRLTACEFCHDFDPWAIQLRYELPRNAPESMHAELAKNLELQVDEDGVVLERHEPKPPEPPDPAWEFLGRLQGNDTSRDETSQEEQKAEPIDPTPCLLYRAIDRSAVQTTGRFMTPPEQVELRWSGPNGGILGTLLVRNRQFDGAELTSRDWPIQELVRTTIERSDDSRLAMTTRSARGGIGMLLFCSYVFIAMGLALGMLFWLSPAKVTTGVVIFRCVSGVLIFVGLWGVALCSYRLWYFSRTVVFDRAVQQVSMKEKSIPQKTPWSCDWKNVKGVEVVRGGYLRVLTPGGSQGKDVHGMPESTPSGPRRHTLLWEINLILTSGDRVRLVNESVAGFVVPIGEQIASFLQVPFDVVPSDFEKRDGVVVAGEFKPYQTKQGGR